MRQIFDKEFAKLSEEEIAELQLRAQKEQDMKASVPKQVQRAQQHDVTKVAKDIQLAVSAELCRLYYMAVLIWSSLTISIIALGTLASVFLSVVTGQ